MIAAKNAFIFREYIAGKELYTIYDEAVLDIKAHMCMYWEDIKKMCRNHDNILRKKTHRGYQKVDPMIANRDPMNTRRDN